MNKKMMALLVILLVAFFMHSLNQVEKQRIDNSNATLISYLNKTGISAGILQKGGNVNDSWR